MRFPRKSWFFAGVLSTIFVFTMVSSAFCETPGIPPGYSDIEQAIYASQEAVYATSQDGTTPESCSVCHTDDYMNPHHAWIPSPPENPGDPSSLYNPYCPDLPPPSGWACGPCHYDYDDDCLKEFSGSPGNGCGACHTLGTGCGWELDPPLPEQCIEQIRPGECFVSTSVVATIDIDPDTLNLKSKGNWITCYIELPEGYDVNQIDVNTVTLSVEGPTSIEAALSPTEVGDYDNDTIPDLMVKFDRGAVQDVASEGSEEMTVGGFLTDGTAFQGTDTVLVIDKGQEHMNDNPYLCRILKASIWRRWSLLKGLQGQGHYTLPLYSMPTIPVACRKKLKKLETSLTYYLLHALANQGAKCGGKCGTSINK